MGLFVCKHCSRHVRPHESTCPFCGKDPRYSGRNAAVVGAMLVGLGVALACSGSVDEGDNDPGDAAADQGPGGSGGVYGPPPPEDAGEDVVGIGGSGGVYGPPPPVDAGEDVFSADAAYGPPPPLDGGEPDGEDLDGGEQDAEQDASDEAMSGAYGPPPDSGS